MTLRAVLVVLIAILGYLPGNAHGAHLNPQIEPAYDAELAYVYNCGCIVQSSAPLAVAPPSPSSEAAAMCGTFKSTSNCRHLRTSTPNSDRSLATRGGGKTFEIIHGVRRAKAAELAGKTSISAEVRAGGRTVEKLEIPLDVLRSRTSQRSMLRVAPPRCRGLTGSCKGRVLEIHCHPSLSNPVAVGGRFDITSKMQIGVA